MSTETMTVDTAVKNILKYKQIVEEAEAFLKEAAENFHTDPKKKSGMLEGEKYQIAYEVTDSPDYAPLTDGIGDAMTKKASAAKLLEVAQTFPSLEKLVPQFFDVEVKMKSKLVTAYATHLNPEEKFKLPNELADLLDEMGLDFRRTFSIKRATIQEIKKSA